MQTILIAIAVIGTSMALSIFGLFAVRKFVKAEQLRAQHEVGGYMLSVVGTLYAIVLGFVVVNVSSGTEAAKGNVAQEVNSMLNICRYAEALPPKNRAAIEAACLNYCLVVQNEEWPIMSRGIICIPAAKDMTSVWHGILAFAPQTQQEQEVYSAILDNYTTMSDSRRIRLITAPGQVSPILWLVLIGGAILTVGFTYFFAAESVRSQALMTACVSLTLALNLLLVVIYSWPYTGDFCIKPTAFARAAKFIRLNGVIPDKTTETLSNP